MFEVIAKVISQQGTCEAGHKVGDEFIIGQHTPCGMCSWAYCSAFPFAEVLQFGASFPWEKNDGTSIITCPDPANPVVFELKRGKSI